MSVLPLAILGDVLISAGSVGAAVAAGLQLARGWRAKRHLAAELARLRAQGIDIVATAGPDGGRDAVWSAARKLDETDRKYVEAALTQGSKQGQENYIGDAVAVAKSSAHGELTTGRVG